MECTYKFDPKFQRPRIIVDQNSTGLLSRQSSQELFRAFLRFKYCRVAMVPAANKPNCTTKNRSVKLHTYVSAKHRYHWWELADLMGVTRSRGWWGSINKWDKYRTDDGPLVCSLLAGYWKKTCFQRFETIKQTRQRQRRQMMKRNESHEHLTIRASII